MLELRLLTDNDIPQMEIWLYKEHVKRWYEVPELGATIEEWIDEIKEHQGKFKWITHFIAMYDGQPIGFCQYYKCIDSVDEDFGSLQVDGAYGIDYLIGEEPMLGKGLGKGMIRLLMGEIRSLPDAQRVTAHIDNNNNASKNSLLSCGFALLDAGGSRYVYELYN